MANFMHVSNAINYAISTLLTHGDDIDVGRWQGVPTEGKPDLITREIIDLRLSFLMPRCHDELVEQVEPNLPWAEDHFQERVGREPSNPGVEYMNWPWWKGQVVLTDAAMRPTYDESGTKQLTSFKFTHTYQERFWPKQANDGPPVLLSGEFPPRRIGIRYEYGDLDDVVELLRREPLTRQATFPIFFPEDTGAVHGGRIPCTLHYHFLMRRNKLHCWYPIRSCDAVRHFRDDLYMACRLVEWVLEQLRYGDNDYPEQRLWEDVELGTMHFTAYSFHVHKGDIHLL